MSSTKIFFWLLPYRFRRWTFRVLFPGRAKVLRARFERPDERGYTFRPFVEKHCIFVHIPKCAGISVSKALFGNLSGGHAMIRDYLLAFDKEQFGSFFKFTFVRNPWDRLVSSYFFLKKGGMNAEDTIWSRDNLSRYRTFRSFVESWVNNDNVQDWTHFIPQYQYICHPVTLRPLIDFIGKFEQIENDYKKVADRLGVKKRLPKLNVTKTRPKGYRQFYTPRTRDIVARVYSKDIEMFGYDF